MIFRGTRVTGGNQDIHGYLEKRRKPGSSGIPGEQRRKQGNPEVHGKQKETSISRGT